MRRVGRLNPEAIPAQDRWQIKQNPAYEPVFAENQLNIIDGKKRLLIFYYQSFFYLLVSLKLT